VEYLKELDASPAVPQTGAVAIFPGHCWRDGHDFLQVSIYKSELHYISQDGSVFIPKCDDLLRAYSLKAAVPGQPFYIADEFGQKTYSFDVSADGTLSNPILFAEEGELGVAVDPEGNVYIAAGNIFVYNSSGDLIDVICVPERPACIAFGGIDGRTLFITARSSLYKLDR
jgi:sugar lactone lactonase YvrE